MSGAESRPLPRPDFSRRSEAAEWLDRADLDACELGGVLRELARFNGAMLGHRPILDWLRRATAGVPRQRTLTVLDAGCGYGDLLRRVRRWADRQGLPLALVGLDHNPQTIAIARAATEPRERIEFGVANLFSFRPAGVDIILSSLVAHHLANEEIVAFLRWMEDGAQRGWLLCDLDRHPFSYRLLGLAGKLLRVHPIVIADGQTSVTRALSGAEWQERLDAAQIPCAAVTMRRFLFRHVIGRVR